MRRIRLGVTTALAAVALTAGCATTGNSAHSSASSPTVSTPAASTPAASTEAATPSPAASSGHSPAPAKTTAAGEGLPDGYDAKRDANADVRAALAEAAREHREVLVDFGANWCPDCRALDVMFRSAQVEPVLRKDYVVVAVDVGQFDHNLDLAGRYLDLRTSGIPALVVLKPNGAVRTATDDGSFANARSMNPDQVSAFLTKWAPSGDR